MSNDAVFPWLGGKRVNVRVEEWPAEALLDFLRSSVGLSNTYKKTKENELALVWCAALLELALHGPAGIDEWAPKKPAGRGRSRSATAR